MSRAAQTQVKPLAPVRAGPAASLLALRAHSERITEHAIRLSVVAVIAWIGAMKFTAYEAEAISGFVASSPILSWVYDVVSVRVFAVALGAAELVIAGLIASGPWLRRVGGIGSLLAAGMFLTTLSFLLTTPGAFEPTLGGFPALSVVPGQFLIKDIVLLAASLWLAARGFAVPAA